MDNLQLYCVSHKPLELPDLPGLNLIQVGSGPDFGGLRDNRGDNIAEKNGEYSELTAFYQVWKNRQSDFVGFCHYRRYLFPPASTAWLKRLAPASHSSGFRVSQAALYSHLGHLGSQYLADFETLLDKADIILPRAVPQGNKNFISQYLSAHDAAPLFRTLALLAEQDDNFGKAAYKYFTSATFGHWNNMFITRWSVFDRYCRFLFPLLARLEQEITPPSSTYQRRVYAFLSERLFNLWLAANRIKATEVDWCIIEESLRAREPHHVPGRRQR